VLGISPGLVLRAGPVERAVLMNVARRAYEFAEQRDQALARLIRNEVVDAMKGRRG
jgi:hypothetical protein